MELKGIEKDGSEANKINITIIISKFNASYLFFTSVKLNDLCKYVYKTSEYIDITCTNENVIFSSRENGVHKSISYNTAEGGISSNHKEDGNITHGKYGLRDIIALTKYSSLCKNIQVFMKNEYPMVLQYSMNGMRILLALTPVCDDEITKNRIISTKSTNKNRSNNGTLVVFDNEQDEDDTVDNTKDEEDTWIIIEHNAYICDE